MDDDQQEQQPLTSPYASPYHQYGGSILLLTNPENELAKLELTLRNAQPNKDGEIKRITKRVKTKDGLIEVEVPPLLNDEGVASVIGQVQSIASQVTVMSNLDDEDIYKLIMFLADTLAKDLMLNREFYQIENSSARDRIFFEALATAYFTMKRAKDEGERRFWKGSQQEITTRIEGQQKKSGGMLSRVLGWGTK